MSGPHNILPPELQDPKVLYVIQGINAYHVAMGREECLTTAGPQTMSLLMVPTAAPYASDMSAPEEEDYYLHLHVPPELDLPLPATTQIYHKPPHSYLIPRWDLGPDSGAFTRIEFPALDSRKGVQEDIDTFETILAQCTSFLERAHLPRAGGIDSAGFAKGTEKHAGTKHSEPLPPYNPSYFQPGQGYAAGSQSHGGGQIVLVDEEDGSVIGELGDSANVTIDDSKVKPGSKDPVEITLPADGSNQISVQPASAEYLEMAMHPAYKKSFLVSNAAYASRLIVTTSDMVSKALQGGAETFTSKTKPAAKPITFQPATHERVRRINQLSSSAVGLSSATVGRIGALAQSVGASLSGRQKKDKQAASKGLGPDGKPVDDFKPGLLNKSLMAFSTIADGIDQAGKNLLTSSTTAASTVMAHRYGPEAGNLAKELGAGFKNVGLVYIDVTGVSRKAVIKSVAKGMLVGNVKGGGKVMVGGGDGGVVTTSGSPAGNPSTASASKTKK